MSSPSEEMPVEDSAGTAKPLARTLQRRVRALAERLRDYLHYHGLWAPGVRLLRRLSLRGKTVLLLSLMGVPTLWLVTEGALTRWEAHAVAVQGRQGVHIYLDATALQHTLSSLVQGQSTLPAAADADAAAWKEEQARFTALHKHLQPWMATHPQSQAAWTALQRQRDDLLATHRPNASLSERRRALDGYAGELRAMNQDVLATWSASADLDSDNRSLRVVATELLPRVHGTLVRLVDHSLQLLDKPDRSAPLRALAADMAEAHLLLDMLRPALESGKNRGLLPDTEVTDMLSSIDTFLTATDRMVHLAEATPTATDLGVDRPKLQRRGAVLLQATQTLHDHGIETLGTRLADTEMSLASRGVCDGLLLATLLGLVVYMQVSFYKVIGGGLNILCQQLHELGRGNLSIRPQARGRDEVAQALDALGASAQHMSQVLEAVTQGVAAVSHASRDVATGNAGLSGRTGEMRDAIGGVSNRAQSFSGAMDRCGLAVEQATEHMHAMRADAQRSRKAMAGLREHMQALQTKSREIARVIEMVEAVAYQTKLLSLNASVEAARAGAAGRGFAVVAQEVRALAQRSETATRKINTIISSSIHEIEDGNLMAERASKAVHHTDGKIEAIDRLMVDIVELTRTAVRESNEVLGITRNVEQSADGNARLVAQLSDASASLRSQGDSLKRSVQHFVLG